MDEGAAEPRTRARATTAARATWSMPRRVALIAIVTVLVVMATAGATLLSTPQYRAESSVYFGLQTGTSGSDLFQGGNFAAQQAVSYAELVGTPTVLEPVIKQLGLTVTADALSGGPVVATTLPNTSIVTIDVTDANAQQAADIANATAQQLGVVVRQLAPRTADNKPTMDATTVRQATVPTVPSAPKLTNNLIAGLLAGLLVGFLVDLLLTRSGWSLLRERRRPSTTPSAHRRYPRPAREESASGGPAEPPVDPGPGTDRAAQHGEVAQPAPLPHGG